MLTDSWTFFRHDMQIARRRYGPLRKSPWVRSHFYRRFLELKGTPIPGAMTLAEINERMERAEMAKQGAQFQAYVQDARRELRWETGLSASHANRLLIDQIGIAFECFSQGEPADECARQTVLATSAVER